MRFAAATVTAALFGVTAFASGFAGENAADGCTGPMPCAAQRLPAPITITTDHLSYHIARDGRVSHTSLPRSPYPRDAVWFPATRTWYRLHHRHLVVGRGRTPRWRSREEIAENQIGLVALGPNAVAFQHDHRLYLAPLGGVERPIASREVPVGWTSGGLYTYSYPRRELLLRADTGAVLSSIARRPLQYEFDLATGNLYFVIDGVLMGAHGIRSWRLGSMRGLGMSADTWLQPIGGMVQLLDNRRLALVRPNGSLFAATSVRNLDRISSFVAIAPRASAVAFTGVTGPAAKPTAENVYLLRADSRSAIAIHHEPGSFGGCAQWANVAWHGSWLLYSDSDGKLAAIDTVRARRAIELTGVARRLLGGQQGFTAQWSGPPAH